MTRTPVPAKLLSDVSLYSTAGLLSTDVSSAVFGLPPNVTQATLGDIGLQEVNDLSTGVCIRNLPSCGRTLTNSMQVPDNMAIGVDQCLQMCGLTRGNQTMEQQQPRTPDNALPLNKK